jgi:tetratricopeptide (TPR) repeat protein
VGRLHWDKKAYREAAEWLSRVTPGDPNYLRALFLLGVSRYQLADFEGARASFASVAEKVPLNEVYNNLGAAESRLNRPEALETFQKALEGDPADPAYHFNVGLAHWKRKNFEAAADCFRATTERDPSDNQATIMLGRCLLKSGPRPGDKSDGMERLKTDFEESAYRSLKAALEPRRK